MSNSVFTPAGRALIAACLAGGTQLEITELIFADIPGLDPAVAPDPAMTIAPETIVHRAVPTAGLIDDKTAVYSTVIAADAGDFHLNAMALLAGETVVAIAVMPRHLKWATTEFRTGNSLVKNFAIEVADVSGLTGIIIEAATWQFDFDHRYEPLGAVEEHDLSEHPHPGKFEVAGAVAAHEAMEDPHPRYNKVVAYGTVAAAGAKISGSPNWTVTRNAAGLYRLNITTPGYYIVLATPGVGTNGNTLLAWHSAAGVFQNNVDNNIRLFNSSQVDMPWSFCAISLDIDEVSGLETYASDAYSACNGEWSAASIRYRKLDAAARITVGYQGGLAVFIPEEIRRGTLTATFTSYTGLPSRIGFNSGGRMVTNLDGSTGYQFTGGSSTVITDPQALVNDANHAWFGAWAAQGVSWDVEMALRIQTDASTAFNYVINDVNFYRSAGYDSWSYGVLPGAGKWVRE